MDDGDIFNWKWKREKKDADYLNYWCCSRYAVFQDGRLTDTYWGGCGSSQKRWTKEQSDKHLILEHIANFSELDSLAEYDICYYNAKDIVNLNHPNSTRGNLYLRSGSKRCRETMLAVIEYSASGYKSDLESAERNYKESIGLIRDISNGKPLEEIYINERQ